MKFSFVNPAPNEMMLKGERTMINASPPLGILYIAAMLKRAGVEVSVLDQAAEGMTAKETANWVIKEDPDILGVSTLTCSSLMAPKIAEEVKKIKPSITVAFGNHHATFNAERILGKYPFVDVIVRGEGEQTCLDLVNYLKEEKSLKDVLGVTFRHANQIVSNLDRPLIKDVDALPFPDRGLLDVEYHNSIVGINIAPRKFTSFITSRGCVFKCRFCSCASMARNLWRPRSIENILEEMNLLMSEGYEQLFFVDDNFTLNQKRVIKLCQMMRKEKIDMEWVSEGRVDQCSYNMLREMKKAGCRLIYFGIESGSQKVLNYYDKRTTPRQSEKAVAKARKAGIDLIIGSFIVGAPVETEKDIEQTFEIIRRIDLDIPQINVLGVYPGSPIWDEAKQKGLLDEDRYWEIGACPSEIYPNTVPLSEIRRMVHDFYMGFLGSRRFLLKQVLLTARSPYRLNVIFRNLSRIGAIKDNIESFTSL
jgi:radical SAM superfamily enzyme YgiQ (UPF0313 family)